MVGIRLSPISGVVMNPKWQFNCQPVCCSSGSADKCNRP